MTIPGVDPYDLERFVRAQERDFARALTELRDGQKRSHWMWYIFPQLRGLGVSELAQRYAIGSEAEARAYLQHPVLGSRLRQCVVTLLSIEGRSAREIMGSPDDLKLRSSATLFAQVSAPASEFEQLLQKFFLGEPDAETVRLLRVPT